MFSYYLLYKMRLFLTNISAFHTRLQGSARTIALCIALGGLLCSCVQDVPHDNVVDPLSPSYSGTGTVAGKVTIQDKPNAPLAGVYVTVIPQGTTTQTDTGGVYTLKGVPSGATTLYFSREGYASKTVQMTMKVGEMQTLNMAMNGYPVGSGMRILTRKINGSPAIYYADVQANADDPNGLADIDSVWFTIEDLKLTMTYDVGSSKLFRATVQSGDLPFGTLEWLVGRPLTIVVQDHSRDLGVSDQFYVSRLIEAEATPVLPANGDSMSASVKFQWNSPNVTFNYIYSLKLARLQGTGVNQIVVWRYTNDFLGSTTQSYTYPNLQSGNYSWAVAVVDEYGNVSQSKDSYFIVR
jgi:hypothetical protein